MFQLKCCLVVGTGSVEVKERHLVAGAIACRGHTVHAGRVLTGALGNCRQGWLQGRWGLKLVPVRMDVPAKKCNLNLQTDLPC